MAFQDEKDGDRRRKVEAGGDEDHSRSNGADRKKRDPAPEVGHALRSVYQRAIEEDIPPEMLDLLGKLG